MINVLLAGVFTLIGATIGALATVFIQLHLRKEKFKEVFYKEKLAAAKELSHCLWHFKTTALEALTGKVKTTEVHREGYEVLHLLWGKGFMISKAPAEKTNYFISETIIRTGQFYCGVRTYTAGEIFSFIQNKYREAANALRQDLHCDTISEAIDATLNPFNEYGIGGVPKINELSQKNLPPNG